MLTVPPTTSASCTPDSSRVWRIGSGRRAVFADCPPARDHLEILRCPPPSHPPAIPLPPTDFFRRPAGPLSESLGNGERRFRFVAWDEFFRSYQRPLYLWLLARIGQSPSEAEELVQSFLTKLHLKHHATRSPWMPPRRPASFVAALPACADTGSTSGARVIRRRTEISAGYRGLQLVPRTKSTTASGRSAFPAGCWTGLRIE